MQQLTQSLLNAIALNCKLTHSPEPKDLVAQLKQWGAGIFRIVVMGEIKKGKSSFINAFLGVKNLVPVASDIATSTIFKIHYGSEHQYRVHFEKGSGKSPIIVPKDQLAQYGTENGNPGNEKQVDFIEVSYPSPILNTGIVIIDTPGLGGLFKEHKRITWQYVPKADAVFFVTDSVESPIGEEELTHLDTVRKITNKLFFVQTKANDVDKEAREMRRTNNLAILSQFFNTEAEQIPYFMVDSLRKFEADEEHNEKKLERSGYTKLNQFVNAVLLSQQHKILANKMIQATMPLINTISSDISSRKATLMTDTEEKQKSVQNELDAARKEVELWRNRQLPELKKELERGLATIQSECSKKCNQLRPNGEIQIRLDDMINSTQNKQELQNAVTEIEQKLPSYAAECLNGIQQYIEKEISQLLSKLAAATSEAKTELALYDNQNAQQYIATAHTATLKKVIEKLRNDDATFDDVRTGFSGILAGATIFSAIGCVIGSVIPVVGTIAGSTLGLIFSGLFGGAKAMEMKEAKELEVAKNQASAGVTQAVSSLYNNISTSYSDLITQYKYVFSDKIELAVRNHTEKLDKQKTEIEKRSRMDAMAIKQCQQQIAADETTLRIITKSIEPWINNK